MTRRTWLPHPPAVIRRPLVCPTGLPRFASDWLAHGAAVRSVTPVGLRPAQCQQCDGGWHLQPPDRQQPGPALENMEPTT